MGQDRFEGLMFEESLCSWSCFPGQPTYAAPASATSPEVKRVCSQSMLLSSIEAPERSLEPDRIAELKRDDIRFCLRVTKKSILRADFQFVERELTP